jgi:hypothetical protein
MDAKPVANWALSKVYSSVAMWGNYWVDWKGHLWVVNLVALMVGRTVALSDVLSEVTLVIWMDSWKENELDCHLVAHWDMSLVRRMMKQSEHWLDKKMVD